MTHGQRCLIGVGIVIVLAAALALIATGGQPSLAVDGTIYVDSDAPGPAHDGSSWDFAYTDLQEALGAAGSGQQIWVAAGTYRPTDGDDRTVSFAMKNNVEIYGGFDPDADDTQWEDRNWETNVTILSGDIGDDATSADNSYHVFYHPDGAGLDSRAILDGFTITGGYADGDIWPHNEGAGMFNYASSPTLANVTFAGNSADHGGGMYNYNFSSPWLTNCTFSDNEANVFGGGMLNTDSSSPTLMDCTFEGNQAYEDGGGMFNNVSSAPTLTNCTFTGNSASNSGGGMFNATSSSPTLTSCSFTANSATYGGGMYNGNSSPRLTDCIFSNNRAEPSGGAPIGEGGGMYNSGSSPTLINCAFVGNSAVSSLVRVGGAMHNYNSSPALTNCTFSGNSTEHSGGAMHNEASSSPTLTNCILWGDTPNEISNDDLSSTPVVTYSDIEGDYNGEGNINLDPTFVDAGAANLRLQPTSPAIDAGNNDAPDLAGITADLGGDLRFANVVSVPDTGSGDPPIVDMGAYETPTDVIFVDRDASGANDGTSWMDAYIDLQQALDAAGPGRQIWVAEGTYTPSWHFDASDPRSATFQMKNEVAIYGGFAGTETDPGQRDWMVNPTILSGDIGEEGSPADNSYHVFYHPSELALDGTAILDGFAISGGNADGAPPHDRGGGIYNSFSSPELTHCTFWNNSAERGGGMFNHFSSPTMTNCTFSGNLASLYGGGMENSSSSPTLANCIFDGNSAGDDGGGMENYGSSPTLTHCIFRSNLAGRFGGGMDSYASSSPVLTNCTFYGNSASQGGGMFNGESSPTLINCILWGDDSPEMWNEGSGTPDVTYTDVQGGCENMPGNECGAGNIDADPLFVDPENGDFHLGQGSPCIDAGTNGALSLPHLDFEGDPRILDGDHDGTPVVDMGVDERYEAPPPVIFVDLEATGDHDGRSWENALTNLHAALIWAEAGVEIWVAEGTYKPTDGTDRLASFQMKNEVSIYGGFAGTETELGQRDWVANPAILSGDLNGDDEPGFVNIEENSYHVFYHPLGTNLDRSARLDGFTITGGNASGPDSHGYGGGMLNDGSSPTLVNLTFAGSSASQSGGGMSNGSGSSPALTNCIFESNSASKFGGGMRNLASSPALTNCAFKGNSASNLGGGMYNWYCSPRMTNCTFEGNWAGAYGGGIYNHDSSPALANCILWGDAPEEMYNLETASPPVVIYSDIQGGCESIPDTDCGTGNIDADPFFLNAAAGDLRLPLTSPAIDAGSNDAPGLVGITTDLAGNPRFADVVSWPDTGNGDPPIVDMGAHEAPPDVILVDQDSLGTNDGQSWEDAMTDLQDALSWAVAGVEIWVAEGTYTPTWQFDTADPRSATFQMVNGAAIYGGFNPTAGDDTWAERDCVTNPTILSGDIGAAGDPSDNSYHVFYHPLGTDLDSTAVLDGFTITGGNANVPDAHIYGGGMLNDASSPTLINLTFAGNSAEYGGGIHSDYSSPVLNNCTFFNNTADDDGGGMHNMNNSAPVLTNCTFIINTATRWGGAMSNGDSNPTLTNVTMSGNSAGEHGDGIFNYNSSPALTNCILWEDDASEEIHNTDGSSTPTVTHSDIQGGCTAYSYNNCLDPNINEDPLFVDATNGDVHLGPGSPCIDAGTNAAPDLPPYDFEGDPRIIDGDGDGEPVVDMGVDEAWARVYLPLVLRAY